MSSRFDVVIAGGGMTGAALALALAQAGKRIAVIDPESVVPFSSEQPYDLRVSAITPASRNLFQNIGVWNSIMAARATPFKYMSVSDAVGTGSIDFEASDIDEEALGYIIENRVISNNLRLAADSHNDVSWICSSVVGFSLEEDDAIISLEDGQVLLSQLLVGADGSNSFVRSHANIENSQVDYQQRAIVAVVEGALPNQALAWQKFMDREVLAFLPLENNQCSIVWSVESERASAMLDYSDEEFCSALMQASDNHIGALTMRSERRSFPLHGMQATEYVRPRLALVGDAAHSIHPLAGQGANLGFQDVAVLCEILQKSDRDLGSMQYLRKYQRKRAGENKLMLHSLEALHGLFSSNNQLNQKTRRIGLKLVSEFRPLKDMLLKHASGKYPGMPALMQRHR